MKTKLTLSIAATLALLLFCVVVTVNSPRGQAEAMLGVDLPPAGRNPVVRRPRGILWRGGDPTGPWSLQPRTAAALEKALAEHEAWHTLPLPEPVQLFVYGGEKDGVNYGEPMKNVPKITEGYYYFRDRLHDTDTTEQFLDASSHNATIALYDTQNTTLYLIEYDS